MAKDYAKVRAKGNKKPSPQRRYKKTKFEGKLWILTAVLMGLFVLSLAYLKKESVKLTTANAKAVKTVKETAVVTKPDLPQPHFDFYTALPSGSAPEKPQTDVAANKNETAAADSLAKPNIPAPTPAAPRDEKKEPVVNSAAESKKSSTPAPASPPTSTIDEVAAIAKQQIEQESQHSATTESHDKISPSSTSYIVQLGLLKYFADADALKAQLVLQGMEVKINSLKKDGHTWYQVWVGPFKTVAAAKKQQQNFADNHVTSKVVVSR